MSQKLCIIHANCQGDTLKYLLEATPSFAREYTIIKYTNYLQEHVDESALQRCQLFLYQHLGEQWGELATEQLLQKLPVQAQKIHIPNMFFNGYWPLWTNETFMAYGDMLLEDLCQRGLSAAEILHIYMKGNLVANYNLEALRQLSLCKERAKEEHTAIKTLDFIAKHWRQEQLFYTVNHPAPKLSLYVAENVLQLLHMGSIPHEVQDALINHEEEFIQPIHPHVGQLYNLPFADAERLYPVYGQYMNFHTYASAYIQCRLQKGEDAVKDFVVYLHLLAERVKKHA